VILPKLVINFIILVNNITRMSVSSLQNAIWLNAQVNSLIASDISTVDLTADNLVVTNGVQYQDLNVKGELSIGTNDDAYILPQTIGTLNQCIGVGADEQCVWISVGGDSDINGITSSTLYTDVTAGVATVDLETQEGITPGAYTSADITVNEYGIITAVSNGAGAGDLIEGTLNQIDVSVVDYVATISLPSAGIIYDQDILIDDGVNATIKLENQGQLIILPQVINGSQAILNVDNLQIYDVAECEIHR